MNITAFEAVSIEIDGAGGSGAYSLGQWNRTTYRFTEGTLAALSSSIRSNRSLVLGDARKSVIVSFCQLAVTPMRVAILGVAGLLSLSSVSFGAVLATEAQIRQAIIGNTISETEDGQPYAEYFLPDGHLRGLAPDGPYTGEWRISGRSLCERSFDEHSVSEWECSRVEIVGSHFAWIDEDGKRYEAQRVAGICRSRKAAMRRISPSRSALRSL